jgi:hypothetical protein
MVADLVRSGRWTAEYGAAQLAEAGITPAANFGSPPSPGKDGAPPQPAGDAVSAPELGLPAGKIGQFDIGAHFQNEQGVVDDRGHQAHVEAATWMADAQLPASIGTEIGRLAAAGAPAWQEMTQPERENHALATRHELQRLWGPRTTDMIGLARLLVAELAGKHKGVIDFMERSGAGSNKNVVVQIAHHAEQLAARRGLSIDKIKQQFPKFFEPME